MRGILVVGVALCGGLIGCAKGGNHAVDPDGGGSGSNLADASCGDMCDQDHDGVFDQNDQCPNTPAGEPVNHVGCSDSQLTATLQPFPPFGLTWTPTGDIGRAGGLVWTYNGIQRMDLFHIYWIICDDPMETCGVSLDGPIDVAAEDFHLGVMGSDFPNGKIVMTNTTQILLDDGTMPPLDGRLTITTTDPTGAIIPLSTVSQLKMTARTGGFGAEIKGTGFTVNAVIEVQDPTTMAWTPYLDYYDAQPTPMTTGTTAVSFGASFYAK